MENSETVSVIAATRAPTMAPMPRGPAAPVTPGTVHPTGRRSTPPSSRCHCVHLCHQSDSLRAFPLLKFPTLCSHCRAPSFWSFRQMKLRIELTVICQQYDYEVFGGLTHTCHLNKWLQSGSETHGQLFF